MDTEFLSHLFDGVALFKDGDPHVLYANPALTSLLEDAKGGNLKNSNFVRFISRSEKQTVAAALVDVAHGRLESADVAAVLRTRGGWIEVTLRLCRVAIESQPLVAVIVRPKTASPGEAREDPLTRLPDRSALLARMTALLRGGRQRDRRFAVLFIDVDNFKQINDQHGHLVGDSVLESIARRLVASVREGDLVTRYGGDEFVVLLEQVAEAREIDPVVERIHRNVAAPVSAAGQQFVPSLSVGVSIASQAHMSPEDLLRDADRAMYAAKKVQA